MLVEKPLSLSASSPLLTRRASRLTLASLLPLHEQWTACPGGGFEVGLTWTGKDGTPGKQVLRLVSVPCTFGGFRRYLVCPQCGRRAMSLFWGATALVCRSCAGLSYVSRAWRDPIRLMHRYDEFAAQLARPGRRPARYYWAWMKAWLALQRWGSQLMAWADRVDVQRARREERQLERIKRQLAPCPLHRGPPPSGLPLTVISSEAPGAPPQAS